jgi:hypothetical protein
MPQYSVRQGRTSASAWVANGDVTSWSMFWLKLASHKAIAHVNHAEPGSLCEDATGHQVACHKARIWLRHSQPVGVW